MMIEPAIIRLIKLTAFGGIVGAMYVIGYLQGVEDFAGVAVKTCYQQLDTISLELFEIRRIADDITQRIY